ncbi:MAG TPA: sulfatase [Anaerohalosphaeraceae bacterium]|nr:sulfatase [Anaerohalosphaeraceae bacterium]HOL31336.1 sulfatase [Anaerohalosphaeraceae bacterium]HPC64608.1 sulfatase [Anaerohalosphaeraceae bacterium]HPO70376.1 sulfatase [Anaerohalosphaeraceae bacterium]HRS71417.1 sulfatase [Anaerohalosphaeraceae bacterium]
MDRREFVKFLGFQIGSASALVEAMSNRLPQQRPNILFIFSDDHAVQAISAYGSTINQTPNIDRLAREGIILDRCYCCNSICAPSRAAVLTGKHSHANGVMTNMDRFDGTQPTFPQMLRQAGYQTALIGKWHLKSDPTGFDYWDILPDQGNYYNPDFLTPAGKTRHIGYVTDLITDKSLDWLSAQRDARKPFLLMCQHKAPHRNWMPNLKHLHLYEDAEIPEPPTLFDDYASRNPMLKNNEMEIGRHLMMDSDLKVAGSPLKDALGRSFSNAERARMTPEQRQQWDAAYSPRNAAFEKANLSGKDLLRWKYQRYVKDYLRCIASVDENIGRLLDWLEVSGLARNTLVVYSADQGFYLGEHGWYDKRWMYEESFRMPFIARWPGHIKAGIRVSALAQNIDFAPTFLEAAGLTVPHEMQGVSLCSLFDGKVPNRWRKALYYHYYEKGEHNVPRHFGIRTDRYKLICYYDYNEWELFDLKSDPYEINNVYGLPDYAEIRKLMLRQLRELERIYQVPSAQKYDQIRNP